MDRDRALEKVRKCMALASSAEPHEAAAALRQAQALMREHGLSDEDVTLADVGEQRVPSASRGRPAWLYELIGLVAGAFGCTALMERERYLSSAMTVQTRACVIFIGVSPGRDIAAFAFEVLQRQLVAARRAHIARQAKNLKSSTKTARGDVFACGWVAGVAGLVKRYSGDNTKPLRLAHEYKSKRFADCKSVAAKQPGAVRRRGDANDYFDGARQGQRADLKRAVGAGAAPRMIGK